MSKAPLPITWVRDDKGERCFVEVRQPVNSFEFEGVLGYQPKIYDAEKGLTAYFTLAHRPIVLGGAKPVKQMVFRPKFKAMHETAGIIAAAKVGDYFVVRGRISPIGHLVVNQAEYIEYPESRVNLNTEAVLDAVLG